MTTQLIGLTEEKAKQLLSKYGPNVLIQKKEKSWVLKIFEQINNPLVILLLLSTLVSFLLHEYIDSIFIFFIVILNTIFGLFQEYKAEESLRKLQSLSITNVRVIRNGVEREIPSTLIVPGDIVFLEEGNKIPADAQLLETKHFEVNESMLTGESLPVLKQAHIHTESESSRLYMGTIVTKGKGYAEIIHTGMKTKLGAIADKLESIETKQTPLQKKLFSLSKTLGTVGILVSMIVFILSFVRDKNLFESLIFAISLAVAAVPEGLPAVMTITLSIGLERMAKRKAIVRKLNAIETLGSLSLIATDKTGTLTLNRMKVKHLWIDGKSHEYEQIGKLLQSSFSIRTILTNSVLCSTASLIHKIETNEWDYLGDPTEGSLLLMAQEHGIDIATIRSQWNIEEEITFSSETMRMTVLAHQDNKRFIFSKGAPESILSISEFISQNNKTVPLNEKEKIRIMKEMETFAHQGLRIIAFSYKDNSHHQKIHNENGQIFLGFVGIRDPARKKAYESVKRAQDAGIRVIMITGDSQITAEAIGIETRIVNKGDDILTGKDLEAYDDESLIEILPKIKIFARTTPLDKYRLVKLYQKLGFVVGVTGDGVNDALALKQADIGVAMGKNGTDVARDTADMVITDDNFATIIAAVEEGRNILRNIQRAIIYLLTCNISEVVAIVVSVMVGLPDFLTPLQILYINLVTDGIPALSFAFSPRHKNLMNQAPSKQLSVLERSDVRYVIILGILGAILTLSSYLYGFMYSFTDTKSVARTMAFTTLTFMQPFILLDLWLMHEFNLSSIKHKITNKIFLIGFIIPLILQPFLIYHPFMQTVFKTGPLAPQYITVSVGLSILILLPVFGKLMWNRLKT